MIQQFLYGIYYLKKTKTVIWKGTYTLMFTAALFIIDKIWKQPKCPSTKEDVLYIHIHEEILLSHENNEILQFEVTWMDLEAIMLTEVRQRKVNTVHYHFYMASKIERNGWI